VERPDGNPTITTAANWAKIFGLDVVERLDAT
jgi:hypothetical protein